MRRSSILGAAAAAALAAGLARRHQRQRLEPPRGARDPARPDRRQHRPLRLHGAGRARQPDGRLELDPVRGPGGRAVLRQARSRGALLRQDRQHRRRRRGRRLPLAVQAAVPQPELVPVRGADGRLGRRPGHQLRPDVRPLPRDLHSTGKLVRAQQDRATTCRSRRTTSARRRSRTTARSRPARSQPLRAAARRSSARPTTRSSSTSAPSSTASTSTSRAGRTSASATRAAARTTSRATTRTRSCCRCPRREVTRDGQAVAGADAPNAVVGVWATHRAQARLRSCRTRRKAHVATALGPGQPPRQPADQRGRSSRSARRTSSTARRPPTTPRTSARTRSTRSRRGC